MNLKICVIHPRRRFLALVDLNLPESSMKKFNRQSKWDISAVQWNPHPDKSQMFATAVSIYIVLAW